MSAPTSDQIYQMVHLALGKLDIKSGNSVNSFEMTKVLKRDFEDRLERLSFHTPDDLLTSVERAMRAIAEQDSERYRSMKDSNGNFTLTRMSHGVCTPSVVSPSLAHSPTYQSSLNLWTPTFQ